MKAKFADWPLDRKIYYVVTILIYAISIIMLAVFSLFYISSTIEQSNNIAREQLSSLTANYDSTLNKYKELAESLTIDESIQGYLKLDGSSDKRYAELVSGTKNTLQNAMNLYPDLTYVAVVSYRFDGYIFRGTKTKINNDFTSVYSKDYSECLYSRDNGTLRMGYNNAFLKEERLLNVYFPVYSITNMINENGLLCMLFNGSLFQTMMPDRGDLKYDSDLILIDGAGCVISSSDEKLIDTSFGYAQKLSAMSGSFKDSRYLYIYSKINKWKYYLVSRIPLVGMYRDCFLMMILLFLICAIVAYVGQYICRRIIYKAYQPVNNVIQMMSHAAAGKLDARVSLDNVGVDFVNLAHNFNIMMDQVNSLMEQVKMDQIMADQLRFNALQSQIQPHFLYNALDSIHWQASAEGNQEMSSFVKALAQFYRLCLSKGQDIIPLEQEMEHVRNYLIIQNIRYDHIIEVNIDMADDCRCVPIPKITLQPLVENSIYHGIKVKEGQRGEIRIEAVKHGKDVYVLVSDNGTGMTDEQINEINQCISEYRNDYGYGVKNVNKRIELLFGKGYGLRYEKNKAGGLTVRIRLPGTEEAIKCIKP